MTSYSGAIAWFQFEEESTLMNTERLGTFFCPVFHKFIQKNTHRKFSQDLCFFLAKRGTRKISGMEIRVDDWKTKRMRADKRQPRCRFNYAGPCQGEFGLEVRQSKQSPPLYHESKNSMGCCFLPSSVQTNERLMRLPDHLAWFYSSMKWFSRDHELRANRLNLRILNRPLMEVYVYCTDHEIPTTTKSKEYNQSFGLFNWTCRESMNGVRWRAEDNLFPTQSELRRHVLH